MAGKEKETPYYPFFEQDYNDHFPTHSIVSGKGFPNIKDWMPNEYKPDFISYDPENGEFHIWELKTLDDYDLLSGRALGQAIFYAEALANTKSEYIISMFNNDPLVSKHFNGSKEVFLTPGYANLVICVNHYSEYMTHSCLEDSFLLDGNLGDLYNQIYNDYLKDSEMHGIYLYAKQQHRLEKLE